MYLKGFQVILKNLLIYFFPIVGDVPHTYCLTTHLLLAFYFMSTIIHSISSPTNDAYEPKWGLTFSSFPLSMRVKPLFTHPYALVRSSLCWISLVYKAFTLSVQCKCVNCTSVYKATYLEGFQIFFKKFLAHFFFHRGTFLVLIPHFLSYTFIGMC